ncbi:MAG: hypothetical protein PWP30_860 [Eubacteriaceae bacterium]|nr:hypothetical protein [Eubacteriaceae bacterium]
MNKTAIKNFAVWARNRLIDDITYKAGLLGITEKEIKEPLPQSTPAMQFFDIGTKDPYAISGSQLKQRQRLAEVLKSQADQTDYETAFKNLVEEVAYTWFNRLIAVRFMEVNDYLPSRVRVLSSESAGKREPDLVTNPFEADLNYSQTEKDLIIELKQANKWDQLFGLLFIKQCNALNDILPNLFEKTSDYTELLLNLSFTDSDGVVAHLVNDIAEDDFDVSKEGQVEIIGWLYQYYNSEPKDEVFALLKKNVKITKERLPAATQLFTPDWIVRYMVENCLGRLWLEHCRAEAGISKEYMNASYYGWQYYLEEAEQELVVQTELAAIRETYKNIRPQDLKVIDPCMGSGHILVYLFDVLMQIYESSGYSPRDAAASIVENNLYGLDIDKRAAQLAYFSVMMKARQYDRRFLTRGLQPHVHAIEQSNGITSQAMPEWGLNLTEEEYDIATKEAMRLVEEMQDAKEFGSILNITPCDWDLLRRFAMTREEPGQISIDIHGQEEASRRLQDLINIGQILSQKYHAVVTNPPYMGSKGMGPKLSDFVKKNYPDSKSDLSTVLMEKTLEMCKPLGMMAMINIPVWMFLSSFEKLRKNLIDDYMFINMIHFGRGVFGSDFGTTAFVIRKENISKYRAVYRKLFMKQGAVDSIDQKEKWFLEGVGKYIANKENFSKIPGMPIAYWVSEQMLMWYSKEKLLKDVLALKAGLSTADNPKYQRFWSEVALNSIGFDYDSLEDTKDGMHKWFPCNSGGEFRKWSTNDEYVIDWQNNGMHLKNQKGAALRNKDFYFLEGLTWNKLSSSNFGVKYKRPGFIFDDTSRSAFLFEDNVSLNYVLGFLSSKVTFAYLQALNPTMSFTNNDLERLPLIMYIKQSEIDHLVSSNLIISKTDWDSFETSWDFKSHPLIAFSSQDQLQKYPEYQLEENYDRPVPEADWNNRNIQAAFDRWQAFTDHQFAQLKANEEELNRIFIDIYGLQDELTPEVKDKDVTIRKADLSREIRSFISYAVGCIFGRYSLDQDGLAYAGGDWQPEKYQTFIPDKDNVLPITDEEYFEDDIVGLFVAFVRKGYGPESLEDNLDFIASALGNKGNTARESIRNYFLKDFYKDHCKIYQKRPIYWLFDSGKENGFKALIYLHRYTADTVGNLRIDYLHRMQKVYESEMARMQETIDNSSNAREVSAATKRREKLIKQLKEAKEYDEKIAHLALARIELDLDDGVKVNYEKLQTDVEGKKVQVLGKI